MGRHQTRVSPIAGVSVRGLRRDGPKWSDPYYCDWGIVVGGRIRRLRNERGWTLIELAEKVPKPEGGGYSGGYFSRLERGWASAPLYVYLSIAAVLEVTPGALLGMDDSQRETTPAEQALLRFIEEAEIEPEEAIVRLAQRIEISELSPTTKR
jgi:transcriptional regulator with XRE-family HTH domain